MIKCPEGLVLSNGTKPDLKAWLQGQPSLKSQLFNPDAQMVYRIILLQNKSNVRIWLHIPLTHLVCKLTSVQVPLMRWDVRYRCNTMRIKMHCDPFRTASTKWVVYLYETDNHWDQILITVSLYKRIASRVVKFQAKITLTSAQNLIFSRRIAFNAGNEIVGHYLHNFLVFANMHSSHLKPSQSGLVL